MTVNDQIRDEKLQYNINREAAKILALSSGKIHKYEYITGEDILPSNQQQIIEQARFTYSPLDTAFEKQIKTTEDQGEKKIKAIQDQGQTNTIKKYDYDAEDTPLISKQKEIFNELADERLEKLINSDDLIYRYKGNIADVKFDEFDNAFYIIDKIRDGKTDLSDVKTNQEKFKSYLREIKKGSKKHISKVQKPLCIILKCFSKQETRLLNFMMIIFQSCLRQNMEQLREQDLKY